LAHHLRNIQSLLYFFNRRGDHNAFILLAQRS
jgi:hypothetical protein